jgi:hypothetical protein
MTWRDIEAATPKKPCDRSPRAGRPLRWRSRSSHAARGGCGDDRVRAPPQELCRHRRRLYLAMIELFFVASGFLIRLIGGANAVQIYMSRWIIIATGMLALLMAVGKCRGYIAQANGPPLVVFAMAFSYLIYF